MLSWMRNFALVLMSGSLLLIGIALVGDLSPLGDYEDPKWYRSWEAYDPELAAQTRSVDSFINVARSRATGPTDAELMQSLYEVARDRFVHYPARHNIFSNWLLWLHHKLARAHPARLKNPEEILARGDSGLCGQMSIVLTNAALRMGINARIVQFGGHTAMESYIDGGWRLYDADAEVAAGMSVAELVSTPGALEEKFPGDYRLGYRQTIGNQANNHVDWRVPVSTRLEVVYEDLKYQIPLSGFFASTLGLFLLRKRGVWLRSKGQEVS